MLYSLEELMLKLKLPYFGHLMGRTDSLEKTLVMGNFRAGEERDDRGWDGWMALLTRWTWVWASSGSWWWTGKPGIVQPMGLQKVDKTEWLNWAELSWRCQIPSIDTQIQCNQHFKWISFLMCMRLKSIDYKVFMEIQRVKDIKGNLKDTDRS